ncbi:MAG TPA: hypothetical protein VMY43_12480 [Methanothrix sp.]|nr:hypothetical protein [Methanothrix sp.]
MRHLGLLTALVLVVVSISQAFPLQTTDGIIKIYGMIPTKDGFALDIFSPYQFQGRGIVSDLKVDVVDSEDRFIKARNIRDVSNPGYNDRALYFFEFDQPATQIKRTRIETPNQDVYSISWSGVPEASTENITIKLYGVKDNTQEDTYDGLRDKQYDFEVKVTNKMTQGLALSPKFFWLLDQFNYGYEVKGEEYKLLPNESVRYTLHSQALSPLSRPKGLCFLPENFTIDLEGWY